MASNGHLPDSALAPIPGGRLIRAAAAAWNAGPAKAGLRPGGPMSSYRTFAQQVYLWGLYLSGRGNLAAHPGASGHGWGLAVDLGAQWMRAWIDRHGAAFGWAKKWSDAPTEWWHIRWRSGVWHGHVPPPALRAGTSGKRVHVLQWMLRKAGATDHRHKRYWPRGVRLSGHFGPVTRRAVKRFQRAHNLTSDGVVGPATWRRLRAVTK